MVRWQGIALRQAQGERGDIGRLSSNCGNPLSVSLPRRGRDLWEWVVLRDVHGAQAVLREEEEDERDADGPYDGGGERYHAVFENLEIRRIDAMEEGERVAAYAEVANAGQE